MQFYQQIVIDLQCLLQISDHNLFWAANRVRCLDTACVKVLFETYVGSTQCPRSKSTRSFCVRRSFSTCWGSTLTSLKRRFSCCIADSSSLMTSCTWYRYLGYEDEWYGWPGKNTSFFCREPTYDVIHITMWSLKGCRQGSVYDFTWRSVVAVVSGDDNNLFCTLTTRKATRLLGVIEPCVDCIHHTNLILSSACLWDLEYCGQLLAVVNGWLIYVVISRKSTRKPQGFELS